LTELSGFQKKYLRGLAHGVKPVVHIGHQGVTDAVIRAADDALATHELIKVKFVDFKEKAQKRAISGELEARTGADLVGMIGHVGIFYRPQEDPEKRMIALPERRDQAGGE
jgi:RNA-binding protein